jgi:hypothetical protein
MFGGAWRSLEAHLNGVQGVGGSNPLAPTSGIKGLAWMLTLFLLVGRLFGRQFIAPYFKKAPGVDLYTKGSNLISQQEPNFCGSLSAMEKDGG